MGKGSSVNTPQSNTLRVFQYYGIFFCHTKSCPLKVTQATFEALKRERLLPTGGSSTQLIPRNVYPFGVLNWVHRDINAHVAQNDGVSSKSKTA